MNPAVRWTIARLAASSLAALLAIRATPASAWVTYLHGDQASAGEETVEGMVYDGSGSLYITGRFSTPTVSVRATLKLSAENGSETWRVAEGSPYYGDILLAGGVVIVGGHASPGGTRLDPANGAVLAGTIPYARVVDGAGYVLAAPDTGTAFTVVKYDPMTLTSVWTSADLATGSVASRLEFALDASNDVYVAGSVYHTNPQQRAWLVAKLSGVDGTTQWVQEIPTSGVLEERNGVGALQVGSDGAVYVAGALAAPIVEDPFAVAELMVKRLNGATGAVEWSYALRGTQLTAPNNGALSLALSADGDVIVGGKVDGNDGLGCGGIHVVVARLNHLTGAEQWRYSTIDGDCGGGTGAAQLAVDGAGWIYVGARRYEPYPLGDDGRAYAFVLKLDPADGGVIWTRSYLGSADGYLQRMILSGTTLFIAGRGDGGATGRDMMVAALTTGGGDYPCGNGAVDAGESCDDGNPDACDGCDATCQVEGGPICGDGVPNDACGEQCDDGNLTPGDGCSDECVDQAAPEALDTTALPGVPVSSDSESDGATAADPLETAVTSPGGGHVAIAESTDPAILPPIGYAILSQVVAITAPAASPAAPLAISFLLDGSRVPAGESAATITVFRNGVAVPDCTGTPGSASPDPCIASRGAQGDDLEFVVLTSHASLWYLGADRSRDVPVKTKKIIIRDNPLDPTKRAISLLAKDPAITPADLSCDGPGGGGATLVISGAGSGQSASFSLPCSNWKSIANPKQGLVAASYRDPDQSEGPCKTVLLKRTSTSGLLKVVCNGRNLAAPVDFDLDTAPQRGALFTLTMDGGRVCGNIVLPRSDTATLFKAVDPLSGAGFAPDNCH